MNTKQYIQHERKWLFKAMNLMLNHQGVKDLNSTEKLRYRELIERVIEGELEFLIDSPEEYQELYGGPLRLTAPPLHAIRQAGEGRKICLLGG